MLIDGLKGIVGSVPFGMSMGMEIDYRRMEAMKIYGEKSLREFDFWSGAVDTVKYLTDEQLDMVEGILEDEYPEGIDETDLNDLFWFEEDMLANWLGYESFEAIMNEVDGIDDEEEDDDWEDEEEEEDEEVKADE